MASIGFIYECPTNDYFVGHIFKIICEKTYKRVFLYSILLTLNIPIFPNGFETSNLLRVKLYLQLVFYFVLFLFLFIAQPWIVCWRFSITYFVKLPFTSNVIQKSLTFSFEGFNSWGWFFSGYFWNSFFVFSW